MDGILPLWKPKGFTSHDCVSKARGMLKTRKIGHTGTLDPDVEGVLPLCVGKATKIVPFLTDTTKVYEAVVTLGYATDTEDASGKTVETGRLKQQPEVQDIKEVLADFTGEITQTPPMYSAVKVDGKKLYEYAREGKTIERPSRKVYISELHMTSYDASLEEDTYSFGIRVACSKGTYIRTLCVDIGKALGFPAHMKSLIRTETGDIHKEDCFTFDAVQEAADQNRAADLLLPLSKGLTHLPSIDVDEETREMVKHGRVLDAPRDLTADTFTIQHEQEVAAVYQKHPTKPGYIKPVRVF
ncbi:tRNA pseudouridine(55) synthase TruB [Halobacillus litoralis]|uniref:tRNA pseudouridine(55) synthase TruB n=1 Tax=Halobacillus litoralis TaxID=45668 RepID=UPI00136BFF8F|nr:tRNA pseudouridine(55) synthase TruB [Halobacillus litoralis]MYL37688.1 tRNA pseudouridine(55) synthase TruB [Halobacillus litoralis]